MDGWKLRQFYQARLPAPTVMLTSELPTFTATTVGPSYMPLQQARAR